MILLLAMNSWHIPKMWAGGECWIIGGGPSMPRQFGVPEEVIQDVMLGRQLPNAYSPYLGPIHGKHVIGINNSYQLGAWIDVIFFGDISWYLIHRRALAAIIAIKVTSHPRFGGGGAQYAREGLKYVPRDTTHPRGISPGPDRVSWNGNSGAAAISLAVCFGAVKVVLLGFDMKLDVHNTSHWHGRHLGKNSKYVPPFHRHKEGFSAIAEDAKRMGIEVINANPSSAIDCLPKVAVQELL